MSLNQVKETSCDITWRKRSITFVVIEKSKFKWYGKAIWVVCPKGTTFLESSNKYLIFTCGIAGPCARILFWGYILNENYFLDKVQSISGAVVFQKIEEDREEEAHQAKIAATAVSSLFFI